MPLGCPLGCPREAPVLVWCLFPLGFYNIAQADCFFKRQEEEPILFGSSTGYSAFTYMLLNALFTMVDSASGLLYFTLAYMSIVILLFSWPARYWTVLGSTPAYIRFVIYVFIRLHRYRLSVAHACTQTTPDTIIFWHFINHLRYSTQHYTLWFSQGHLQLTSKTISDCASSDNSNVSMVPFFNLAMSQQTVDK